MSGYKDLDIYQQAYNLAIRVHKMSLTLPKYELYEQGSQVRTSSKRIKDSIAEGYGRRRYKADYIKFLIYAQASCDEVLSQLNMIQDIYFQDGEMKALIGEYQILGSKINKYIQYVDKKWNA